MSYKNCSYLKDSDSVIGLFGTCGNSNWRESFINDYEKLKIPYFNPNKKDWNPNDAIDETFHLNSDDILLFPILGETFGTASLAETAFSVLNCISNRENKYTIILIEDLLPELYDLNPQAYKESNNARVIVKSHLSKINNDKIFIAKNLDHMKEISIALYDAVLAFKRVKNIIY